LVVVTDVLNACMLNLAAAWGSPQILSPCAVIFTTCITVYSIVHRPPGDLPRKQKRAQATQRHAFRDTSLSYDKVDVCAQRGETQPKTRH